VCARHSPTDSADGASKVTTRPMMQWLNTSIATVTYGRPTGSRCQTSTTVTSTMVWPIWTCSNTAPAAGATPAADRSARAASDPGPSRAAIPLTGSSLAMRRSIAPRDGTRSPRRRHTRAISRCTAATDRFCRVR
jgi:hypothetical protein